MPTTFAPDMTPLTTSGWKRQRKNRWKCRLRQVKVKFLEKVLCEDHQIAQGCQGKLAPQICQIWRRWLLSVGCKIQLNTTGQKWCAKKLVRPARSQIIQPLLVFVDRYSLKLKKTAQNAASNGFGSKFSGAAFCLPHQLVGFLFSIWQYNVASPFGLVGATRSVC